MSSDCDRRAGLIKQIKSACMSVFQELGSGWREDTYREAVMCELALRNVHAVQEVSFPITYKNQRLSHSSFRVDIMVDDIVVELKAITGTQAAIDKSIRQCRRYASQLNCVGLVVNFTETDQPKSVSFYEVSVSC